MRANVCPLKSCGTGNLPTKNNDLVRLYVPLRIFGLSRSHVFGSEMLQPVASCFGHRPNAGVDADC